MFRSFAFGYRAVALLVLSFLVSTTARAADYEAESGTLSNGTTVSTARAGYSGTGYVTNFAQETPPAAVEIPVTVATAGGYTLTIRYASEFSQKNTRVFVDGADAGEVTLAQTNMWAEVAGPQLILSAGAHVIKLERNWGFYDIDAISLDYLPPAANVFEAENGTLTDIKPTPTLRVSTSRSGYSGSGYVEGFQAGNDESFAITVDAPQAGEYLISFRYASEFGTKFTRVSVNGVATGEWELPQTASFTTKGGPVVTLAAGANLVTLYAHWGYYEMDAIILDYLPPTASAYEAEDGELTGVVVTTDRAGFSGTGYVTGFDADADAVTLLLNLQFTGPHQITVLYASPFGEKKTRLVIDGIDRGEITLPASTTFADAIGPVVQLTAGVHTLTLQKNWGFYEIDRVDVDFVPPPVGTEFEAETGTLHQVNILTTRAGFSGTGYVGDFGPADAAVDIPVNVAEGGTYRIGLLYASPFGDKNTRLYVNGTDYGEVTLPMSQTFATATGPIASLSAGLNIITVSRNWGFYEIDRLDLELVPPPVFNLAPRPIDPLAAPETVALYRYLRQNFGQYILSGQTEEPTSTPETWHDYIADVTGKLPAIRVLDFLPFTVVDGWDDGSSQRAIHWHRDLGGVISYQWHWFAPPSGFAYLQADTTFDVTKAVDPTQPEYQLILADIDVVARELGKLAANRVPVLFRPLHEAEGGWFWWGSKGPEPAKQLYRIIHDRLTHHHGLHNIIWVWNSIKPEWYPGNAYVDIVSWDVYRNPRDYDLPPSAYLALAELAGGRKIIALAENGPIPDPDPLFESKTLPSWFNTWWGVWIQEGYNDQEHLIDVYSHPKVLTLDELADLRAAPAVAAFENTQYGGYKLELPMGLYNSRALAVRGVVSGQVQSLRVPRGYAIAVFSGDNFTGKLHLYINNVADLSKKGFKGPVRSAIVVKLP